MAATVGFASSLLTVIYVEAAVIVALLLLVLRVGVVGMRRMSQRDRARRERDEARRTLHALERMSEIRVETVTRLRGFSK